MYCFPRVNNHKDIQYFSLLQSLIIIFLENMNTRMKINHFKCQEKILSTLETYMEKDSLYENRLSKFGLGSDIQQTWHLHLIGFSLCNIL